MCAYFITECSGCLWIRSKWNLWLFFLSITLILFVTKNKVMGTLEVHKKVLCNFLITYEKPDMQGLSSFLQTEYSLHPEHLDIVTNHLNFYFLGVCHKKWKKCLFWWCQSEKRFEKWLNTKLIVTFSGIKAKGGRKSSCMNFDETSTATGRRESMSFKENFTVAKIQDAFLRNLRRCGRKKNCKCYIRSFKFRG